MSDDAALVRWFLAPAVPEWPSEPFRLWPWVEVADPVRWRTRLLFDWATGDDAARARVLEDLHRLADLLGSPAPAR